MKIQIANINVNNHAELKNIASIAGYAASIEMVNETQATIDLGDHHHHQKAAGITMAEIQTMLSLFIVNGFSIQRV